jgi:hypothetical protein
MARFVRGSTFLFAACAAVLASAAVSRDARADELRWTHFGLRPLAMGNAYVAVADDYNALFYNPAGLARLKEWDGELLNPYFEISKNTASFYKDLSTLMSGSSGDTTAVLDVLEKNTGKTQHFALGLTPHFIMKGFGFAAGIDLNTTLAFHREISADVNFGPRIIVPVGFAMNFLEDRLSLGASLKFVAKGGIDREFSINDIEAFTKSDSADDTAAVDPAAATVEEDKPELKDYFEGGTGVGMDVGMLFTPIKTMAPTLGLSITDFGGTPYKKADIGGEALGAPAPRLPSVNAGISVMPYEANNMFVRGSVDAHAINQPEHYSKKFNLGVEWGYGSIIKVQSGLHQGEFSGGFEFDVFLFSCRFVTYAEQLGTVAGQDENLSDRRYALQLKLLI